MSKKTFLGKIKVFLGIKKQEKTSVPVKEPVRHYKPRKAVKKPAKARKPVKKPVKQKKPKPKPQRKTVKKQVTMPVPWSRVEKYKKVKRNNYW